MSSPALHPPMTFADVPVEGDAQDVEDDASSGGAIVAAALFADVSPGGFGTVIVCGGYFLINHFGLRVIVSKREFLWLRG